MTSSNNLVVVASETLMDLTASSGTIKEREVVGSLLLCVEASRSRDWEQN